MGIVLSLSGQISVSDVYIRLHNNADHGLCGCHMLCPLLVVICSASPGSDLLLAVICNSRVKSSCGVAVVGVGRCDSVAI